MGQKFFEVFPTLKLDKESHSLMEDVLVTRVVTTKARDMLKVYITSNNLIDKETIYRVEKELPRQLFAAMETGEVAPVFKLLETYHLSAQYDPQNLFKVYLDSMLLELREYSPVLYSMLKTAEITFEGKQVTLELEDIPLYKQKENELLQILDKVVCERCGVEAEFFVTRRAATKGKFQAADEIEIRNRVVGILERAAYGGKSAGASDTEYVEMPQTEADGMDSALAGGKASPAPGGEKEASPAPAAKKPDEKKSFGGDKGGFKKDKPFRRPSRKSDDPDMVYGYDVDGELTPVDQILEEVGEVVIRGQVMNVEERPIRNEKTIYSFFVTDFTDTIKCKMFCPNEDLDGVRDGVGNGKFVTVKGLANMDTFDHDITISVKGIRKAKDNRVPRMDNSIRKRVELHCHTKYSEMDGVSDVGDIVKRAYKWGHPAIAITDHGGVQALADVFHGTWDKLYGQAKAKAEEEGKTLDRQDFFKVIIGCEIYLVDDLKTMVTSPKGQSLMDDFVVFDIETTGFSCEKNHIIEIGAVKVSQGAIVDRFSTYVNPHEPIPTRIVKLTTITDEMVMNAPSIEEVLPEFLQFCEGCMLVAHNAQFDISFIKENAKRQNIPFDYTYVDTVAMARVLLPHSAKFTLDAVAKHMGVSLENHHRAVDDAGATAEIFEKFIPMLIERGMKTVDDLNALEKSSEEAIRKLPSFHAIVLAKNDTGRVNLYKLISEAHVKYWNRRPKVPKSLILENREGLIIGSACEAGELYRALLEERSDEQIASIVNFYDYLEIQPVGNNAFMIESERVENVGSEDDIKAINKKICDLGEQFNKPVCATCDVHFLDPEDEVYRRIIMAGKGFKDADSQAPLYLRTTEEMLEEFAYLGSDKAQEVVIDNTNLIADMIDSFDPVRPDKCPPVIENSDQTLTDICYRRAHEIYGEELPDIVVKRLEKELNSIISNGFAVMYIIAQKLVWKSVEDGYLVGSRGSVGSSFVAFMSGITEVNSLSPHYYCTKCHYTEFDSEEVKQYSGMAGCDMPDKICPNCGELLVKDGFDIPFETFLGFKGDKEPDIDLNFSGEYQSKAHKYTEVIFGYGQTFRAGTIGTLADKTAYGYVKKYFEEHNIHKRSCEIERISVGCTGILRSTGQHPGGIVVLPLGEEIYSFTPVQHPANDMTTDIITTHFDYHKIDHNLLKLDILGHDDPTMIRMLEDLTGLDPTTIPLDDKQVMSLFQDTSALHITPDDIMGTRLGTLGVPEFGTDFAMQMCIDAKPKYFSDLVRISGLSHGTDVWLGNAQTLIEEGKATISTAICTRDDIMVYLIHMGMEEGLAFTIMESVRKGKGLKDEWVEQMLAHGVPDWYIGSCRKIKYMFPKAHAAAYVMMGWRVAYCKVYYPMAYYTAFFSIRADSFSYEIMCQGKEHLESVIRDFKKRGDLSGKEEGILRDGKIVQEMYARGFEFHKLDIYKAHSRLFQIIDGKIMPSLNSIDGMGDKAAEALMEAARGEPFLSRDDLKQRSKVPQSVIDKMNDMGLLGDIPESNQLSLFDFM